ncbi:MAG: hypothetical protein E7107_02170 [Prevotella sp.]|nr:hypothetical protein [Prevotella sp.]
MKKYLFMLAMFFGTCLGFTACSSEEDAALNAEQERGVVKTQFTISFPTKMAAGTRQSITVVQGQATPTFRGINSIILRPFTDFKTEVTSGTALSSSLSISGIANNGLFTTNNSHLYQDVEVPIGTRSFLFYGTAIASEKAGVTPNALNGSLTANTITPTNTLADISYTPTSIYNERDDENKLEVPAYGQVIADYLTAIANAQVTATDATTSWANSKELGTLYTEFIEMKAGSWTSVKAAIQALYTTVYSRTEAVAGKIRDAILANYTVDDTSKPLATDNAGTGGASTGVLAFTDLKNDYGQYPANIGLPDGAAYVKWDTTDKKFKVLTSSSPATPDNGGMNFSSLNQYAFPASLYYNGLSNIKTSETSKKDEYKNDVTWEAILNKYTDDAGVVSSKTRSIAIIDPVQYAVGRLDVAVQSTATLKDNEKKDITVGENFPITGILVGNQKAVNFKFETTPTVAATSASDIFTVYDSQIPTTESTITKTCRMYGGTIDESNFNQYCTHTLVLETADCSADDDLNNVAIAVEFTNNTTVTIVGKDKKLIYPGTKFYLVGTLQPYKNTSVKYQASHLPTGKTTNDVINRAFVQDYTTKVTFNVKSLENAYNVVPDLRNPHLEIGLSVDLTWVSGITQTIDIQ